MALSKEKDKDKDKDKDVEMKDVESTTSTSATSNLTTETSATGGPDMSSVELLKKRFESEILNRPENEKKTSALAAANEIVTVGDASESESESVSDGDSNLDKSQFGETVEAQFNIQSIAHSIKAKRHQAKPTNSLNYQRAPKKVIPKNIYYGISMPANVVNTDRALESVGGLSQITKVFKSPEVEFLQFKFRPDNPNCRPAFGDKVPTCNMLLRIRKNKNNDTNINDTSSPSPAESAQPFSADIIAVIPSTIKFDGMADFQYIVRPDVKRDAEKYFEVKDEELNVLPTIFSRIDHPQAYHFKTNPLAVFIPETHQFVIGSKPSDFATIQVIKFESTDPIPTLKKPIDSVRTVHSLLASHRVIKELFEERPCWSSVPLKDYYQKRGGSLRYLKLLVPFVGYSFVNGPWRLCYVRYGYDPRLDPYARMYHVIDFRLDKEPTNTKVRRTFVTPRRGATLLNTFNYQNLEAGTPLLEGYSPPIFDYTFREMPTQSRLYQVCDFEDPKLKSLCQSLGPAASCSKTGWFTEQDLKLITNEMRYKCGMPIRSGGGVGAKRTATGKSPAKKQAPRGQKKAQSQSSQLGNAGDEEDDYYPDEMSQFMQDQEASGHGYGQKHGHGQGSQGGGGNGMDTDNEGDMHMDMNMHMDMHFPTLNTNEEMAQGVYDILENDDDEHDEDGDKEIETQLNEFESDQEHEDLEEEEDNIGDDEDDFNDAASDDQDDSEESFDPDD